MFLDKGLLPQDCMDKEDRWESKCLQSQSGSRD